MSRRTEREMVERMLRLLSSENAQIRDQGTAIMDSVLPTIDAKAIPDRLLAQWMVDVGSSAHPHWPRLLAWYFSARKGHGDPRVGGVPPQILRHTVAALDLRLAEVQRRCSARLLRRADADWYVRTYRQTLALCRKWGISPLNIDHTLTGGTGYTGYPSATTIITIRRSVCFSEQLAPASVCPTITCERQQTGRRTLTRIRLESWHPAKGQLSRRYRYHAGYLYL